ncbi:MAG: transposase [Acidimicrobiia bacterium]|nr:transposase [Acidimicrobiia bacterium]
MGRPAKYPEEFRREAIELYRSSDRSRAEAAKSLGVADGSLAAWLKAARPAQPGGQIRRPTSCSSRRMGPRR